jgi:hypothetical protein
LALAYDSTAGSEKLYLDGDLVASSSGVAAPTYDTHALYIGTGLDGNNYGFVGDIDEVKIWTTARTLEQVVADMHTCTPTSLSGLAAYWSFDEGAGQVAHDATTNANTLQLGTAVTADGADPTWISSTVPF